ncbi:GNAT family N-acetyltransferase [Eremococcus coleocola]|uniref:Acetyltransferase, GNAT family n=1 Tax=Eremococcus coleocola ACS-139-V-Col8 TaxID=908337 RepID=E4KMI7_9LACT|nr:GNAT family N-acetyltransferase [Eremococcus coleocola]EFR31876.1 acetyltransferase, GNAT family [Eremococcus coleocola ACS-139-V-Col8]
MKDNIRIVFAKGDQLFEPSRRIRQEVFVGEQEIPEDEEFDGLDGDDTYYVVAFDGLNPVATIRYVPEPGPDFRISRIATLKPYRNQGIAALCLAKMEDFAQSQAYHHFIIHSDLRALGFYKSQGYQECSDHYFEDGIECVTVDKTIK